VIKFNRIRVSAKSRHHLAVYARQSAQHTVYIELVDHRA
jgi:hypothetical protein